ncbi:MAG: alkaline phosphatase [Porphyromonas sp.]|nr:alkaline phosphatase [Porphyromonas sp.]
MNYSSLITLIALLWCFNSGRAAAQEKEYQSVQLPQAYDTVTVQPSTGARVKNVILMIGDGMSLSHIANLWTANRGNINLQNAEVIGLQTTYTADTLITDSAAAATAIATGHKTNYHYLGVTPRGEELTTIMDIAHQSGLGSGVVVTCRLWDATPAAFLAHNIDRDDAEDIIGDYPTSNADLIIGGGAELFTNRQDRRDLFQEMADAGYAVTRSIADAKRQSNTGRILSVVADNDLPLPAERGDYLTEASLFAVDHLKAQFPKGFFLMIEGSQLDDYGHSHNLDLLMQETADFDRTVGAMMKWAEADGETLVIITADHETGGLTLVGGSQHSGTTVGHFSTGGHSGVIVPVYSYGPGADHFTGIFDNTDIFRKIIKLLHLH